MKCSNCQTEMMSQQGTTQKVHLEQLYCPNCEQSILTYKEVEKYD